MMQENYRLEPYLKMSEYKAHSKSISQSQHNSSSKIGLLNGHKVNGKHTIHATVRIPTFN